MNIPYVMKKCNGCDRWLVASTVNFYRGKGYKYGLKSKCKECRNKEHGQYYENNKDKIAEYGKRYYENNKDKIAERNKQYCETNKDKIAEYGKQYRKNNKDKITKKNKQYYQDNKDKLRKQRKQYRQSPQGQISEFNRHQRRRIKEEQQGDGITKDQWVEMMSFFGWRCAYSGEVLTKDNRTIDHIVPLNSNGDNMIWNCVPMTRSLNSSKHDKDMLKWYKEQDFYSEARLAKIYEWKEHARKKWKK